MLNRSSIQMEGARYPVVDVLLHCFTRYSVVSDCAVTLGGEFPPVSLYKWKSPRSFLVVCLKARKNAGDEGD